MVGGLVSVLARRGAEAVGGSEAVGGIVSVLARLLGGEPSWASSDLRFREAGTVAVLSESSDLNILRKLRMSLSGTTTWMFAFTVVFLAASVEREGNSQIYTSALSSERVGEGADGRKKS